MVSVSFANSSSSNLQRTIVRSFDQSVFSSSHRRRWKVVNERANSNATSRTASRDTVDENVKKSYFQIEIAPVNDTKTVDSINCQYFRCSGTPQQNIQEYSLRLPFSWKYNRVISSSPNNFWILNETRSKDFRSNVAYTLTVIPFASD